MRFFEPHILSQETREIVWFLEPHILCLSHTISHTTGERMCGSKNRTFSLPCRIPFHMRQHREREVLRTSCSLPLAYHLPQHRRECVALRAARSSSSRILSPTTQEGECVALGAAHSLSLSRTISHNTGERNARFFEPHISLCLSHTVAYETIQRT